MARPRGWVTTQQAERIRQRGLVYCFLRFGVLGYGLPPVLLMIAVAWIQSKVTNFGFDPAEWAFVGTGTLIGLSILGTIHALNDAERHADVDSNDR